MFTETFYRKLVAVFQAFLYIVRGQHGIRADILHILFSQHQDIGVCFQQDPEISHKAGNPPA